LLAGVTTYYVRALHGDLGNFPDAFEGIADLLDRGATSRLALEPPVAREVAAETVAISDEEPQPFPVPEEMIAAALGAGRPQRKFDKAVPPLKVSVAHGDLRLTKFPVAVGHYAGDAI